MMTRSQTRIAQLEARIAELEKENETLKKEKEVHPKRRVYVSMYTDDYPDNHWTRIGGRQLSEIKWVGEVDKSMTPKEIFEFAKEDNYWVVEKEGRVSLDGDDVDDDYVREMCSTYLILDYTEDEERIEKEYDLKTHKEIVEGEGSYDCGCYFKQIKGAPFMCDKNGYDYKFHDKNGYRTGSEILYKKNEDGEWCENYVCKECVDDWKEQGARDTDDEFTDDEDE